MAEKTQPENGQTKIPGPVKFFFAGCAGMLSQAAVHPIDLVKTRVQVAKGEYKNPLHCFIRVIGDEGFLALYSGISGSLLRQATYATTRLGVYQTLNEYYKTNYGSHVPIYVSLVMGAIAGTTGAIVGTPTEVGMIRMMTDGRMPVEDRRNYKHIVDAILRIVKEEGVAGLFRGTLPTVNRAIVVSTSQLPAYSQSKNFLINGPPSMRDGLLAHFVASMFAGLVVTTASLPLDMAKTRMQNMKIVQGVPEYSGMTDVILKVVRKNGVFTLWRGFTPYFLRNGPHTVMTFIFLEQMNRMYYHYVLGLKNHSSGI